ncbi:MAG: hypothetical protein ABI539_04625 [Acidobacteriota bacterium]
MWEKYKATIQGDRIEWDGAAPDGLSEKSPVKVEVTVVSSKPRLKKPNGKRMAAALAKIAARGGVGSIKDPSKWQREIRKDRKLAGRD